MPNLTGKMLGKVHVDMFLAKGGMAEVYIGTHTTLHRSVAIKFLKADLQEEPELRDRFEREARVIAMLRHPNIVQIFDFDSHGNQPYLVMEYVPGASLGAYLRELHKKNERLNFMQVRDLLKKIAAGRTRPLGHCRAGSASRVRPAHVSASSTPRPRTPLPSPAPPG